MAIGQELHGTRIVYRIVYFWPYLQIANPTDVGSIDVQRLSPMGACFLCLARFSYHEFYTILSLFTRTVTVLLALIETAGLRKRSTVLVL